MPREAAMEAAALLQELDIPFSVAEIVQQSFLANTQYPTPFPPGRFSDGSFPVYSAAREEETCVEEVKYHLQLDQNSIMPRRFVFIVCNFAGTVLVLSGHEATVPDLVSADESGYPRCRQIAREAREAVQGLSTTSARRQGATCVPIFHAEALNAPREGPDGLFDLDNITQEVIFRIEKH